MSADTPIDEHRSHVTIVFCDVSNSSGLARELEPEDYSDLLSNLRDEAEEIVSRFGGEIVRMGPESRLAPARRKVMVQKFATHAAHRLHRLRDPDMGYAGA